MRAKYELTEAEIKEAVAAYVKAKMGADYASKDVCLRAEEKRDFADRPMGGHSISATVG